MRSVRRTLPLAILATAAAAAHAQSDAPIAIDGLFNDWNSLPRLIQDDAGDSTHVFDVTWLRARTAGSVIHLYFDVGETLNFQAGDAADGALRIRIGLPSGGELVADLRARSFTHVNAAGAQLPVQWSTIDFAGAPTYASDRFEMRFDLEAFGVGPGDQVTVRFDGSDETETANIMMEDVDLPEVLRSTQRADMTDFRIANLNTLQSGLTHPVRGPLLERLISAVDADIYTFQEEWNNSVDDIADALLSADPHEDGAAWNVFKVNGAAIACRSPMVTMPIASTRFAGAVVNLDTGPVAVFSVHLKCCGHIGSSEDVQRINEVRQIADVIADLRSQDLGPQFNAYADAPVIVIGDWNLVGSRTPLSQIEEDAPNGAGLTHLLNRHVASERIYTWRSNSSSFTPGLLDLIAYSDDDITARNRFVLDSETLPATTLKQLGLSGNESTGSDHLMVVADFTRGDWPRCPGDANGDGVVDFNDLNRVLQYFDQNVIPGDRGDLNNDGRVNQTDVDAVMAAWGQGC